MASNFDIQALKYTANTPFSKSIFKAANIGKTRNEKVGSRGVSTSALKEMSVSHGHKTHSCQLMTTSQNGFPRTSWTFSKDCWPLWPPWCFSWSSQRLPWPKRSSDETSFLRPFWGLLWPPSWSYKRPRLFAPCLGPRILKSRTKVLKHEGHTSSR